MALLIIMAGKYDVIIVGGGPAGIFAALELAGASVPGVLLIEGRDIDGRRSTCRFQTWEMVSTISVDNLGIPTCLAFLDRMAQAN